MPSDKIKDLKLPVLTLLAGLLISFSLSWHKLLSAYELSYYYTGLILALIIPSLSSDGRRKLIYCLLLAGVAVSLLAIYQYFFGFARLANYASSHQITNNFVLDYLRRKRVFLPFVTPNALAGFLIMIIPLTFIKKNYLVLLIPLGAALILTQSLGAILSLFLACAFYFLMLGGNIKRKILALSGLLLIMIVILLARLSGQSEHTRPAFSTLMRLRYWQDTLAIILKSPFLGTGMGNFNLAYSRFTHNSYLQFWAENGIICLAAIVWLAGSVIKKAVDRIINSADKHVTLALLAASMAFLLHNALDFTFFLPEVSLIWWIILGLLI